MSSHTHHLNSQFQIPLSFIRVTVTASFIVSLSIWVLTLKEMNQQGRCLELKSLSLKRSSLSSKGSYSFLNGSLSHWVTRIYLFPPSHINNVTQPRKQGVERDYILWEWEDKYVFLRWRCLFSLESGKGSLSSYPIRVIRMEWRKTGWVTCNIFLHLHPKLLNSILLYPFQEPNLEGQKPQI